MATMFTELIYSSMIAILLRCFALSSSVAGKQEQLNGFPGSARWQSFQTLTGRAEYLTETLGSRLNTRASGVGGTLSDFAIFHFSTRFSNFQQAVSDADFSFYMNSHPAKYLYLFNKHSDNFDRFHVFQTLTSNNDTHISRGVHTLVNVFSDEFERSNMLQNSQTEKEPILITMTPIIRKFSQIFINSIANTLNFAFFSGNF